MKALIEARLQRMESGDVEMDIEPTLEPVEQGDVKSVPEENMYDAIVEKAEEEALHDSMEV